MFHLNRWNQHQLYFESSCDYQCLGCNIPEASTISAKQVIEQSQKHDIINIYSGNPTLNESLLEYCQYIKHHECIIRLWSNHLGIRSLLDATVKILNANLDDVNDSDFNTIGMKWMINCKSFFILNNSNI